jgi:hypothetical protein
MICLIVSGVEYKLPQDKKINFHSVPFKKEHVMGCYERLRTWINSGWNTIRTAQYIIMVMMEMRGTTRMGSWEIHKKFWPVEDKGKKRLRKPKHRFIL